MLNSAANSLAAYCRGHGHGQCKVNRVLRKRPVGYLVAWLLDGCNHASKEQHIASRHCRGEDSALSYERRRDARDLINGMPALAKVLDLERQACNRDGDVSEPEDLPP